MLCSVPGAVLPKPTKAPRRPMSSTLVGWKRERGSLNLTSPISRVHVHMWEGYRRHTGPELHTGGVRLEPAGFGSKAQKPKSIPATSARLARLAMNRAVNLASEPMASHSQETSDAPRRPSLAAAAAAAIAAVCCVYSCSTPAILLRIFGEPSCSDAGPWPCEEEGCPSPSLGCADLAELGVCLSAFSDIWTTPPANAAGRTTESTTSPDVAGQRGPSGLLAEAGRALGQPRASSGAERVSWPKPVPAALFAA